MKHNEVSSSYLPPHYGEAGSRRLRLPAGIVAPLLGGALALVLLAGCSGSGQSGIKRVAAGEKGQAAAPGLGISSQSVGLGHGGGACALVTQQEAQEILGVTVKTTEASASDCEYDDDQNGYNLSVSVERSLPGGDAAKQSFEDDRKLGLGGALATAEDVSGVGDRAFIRQGLSTIYVLKGNTFLTVQVVNQKTLSGSDADRRSILTSLARQALARL